MVSSDFHTFYMNQLGRGCCLLCSSECYIHFKAIWRVMKRETDLTRAPGSPPLSKASTGMAFTVVPESSRTLGWGEPRGRGKAFHVMPVTELRGRRSWDDSLRETSCILWHHEDGESDTRGLPMTCSSKESTWNAGDPGLIPGSGRPPGGGHGNPLQYSCPENPMYRGAWWARVHGVTQSDTTEGLDNSNVCNR